MSDSRSIFPERVFKFEGIGSWPLSWHKDKVNQNTKYTILYQCNKALFDRTSTQITRIAITIYYMSPNIVMNQHYSILFLRSGLFASSTNSKS